MKKYFYLAVIALACIACNSNSVDSNTRSAVEKLSSSAVSALGKSHDVVVADVTKAGFVKVEGQVPYVGGAPEKRQAKKVSSNNEETYVLNMPDNWEELVNDKSDGAEVAFIDAVIESGKPAVFLVLAFDEDDIFCYAEFTLIAGKNAGAGSLFVSTSEDFFDGLNGENKRWHGSIISYPDNIDEYDESSQEDMYKEYPMEKRDQYEKDVVSAVKKVGYIEERAENYGETDFGYSLFWEVIPETEELKEMGIEPFVTGAGYISLM